MPYDHGWMVGSGAGMFFGILWMILVWIVPLLVLAALVKYLLTRPRPDLTQETATGGRGPLDVLKEAYARGDISREEFLQKRDDILEK